MRGARCGDAGARVSPSAAQCPVPSAVPSAQCLVPSAYTSVCRDTIVRSMPGFHDQTGRALVRRRGARRDCARGRDARARLQRRADGRALPRAGRGLRRPPAPDALRASRPTRRWPSPAACGRWARAPTPTPAGEIEVRAGRRLPARTRSSSPASARRATELGVGDRPRPGGDQRRVVRRDDAHCRISPPRTAAAPASPSASTPTSMPAATRTSRPATPPPSSACRSTTAAAMIREMARSGRACRSSACTSTSGRRLRNRSRWRGRREAVADLARALAAEGIHLEHLDLGGGLGIAYEPGQTVVLGRGLRARAVLAPPRCTGSTLVLEPGRWIVGPAGVLLAQVVDLKPQPGGRWFVVIDAGMTDLLRPALYGAWHGIEPVAPRSGRADPRRRRRSGLRNERHARPRPRAAAGRGRRPRRDPRHRRLRRGDGLELQSSPDRRRSDGGGRHVARRAPAPDDRRPPAVGRVMLIAFEGLDQSGKETQARTLRARLEQDGHKVRSLSFPDYGTPIGREIQQALAGERDFPPDVMQLLYVANRYEHRPRLERLARRRRRRHLRSLPRVERRLRRSAGPRRRLADRHPAPPARVRRSRSCSTSRRRPPPSASRPDRDRYERDLGLLARVRESYRRQARQPNWALIDAELPKDDVAAAVERAVTPVLARR